MARLSISYARTSPLCAAPPPCARRSSAAGYGWSAAGGAASPVPGWVGGGGGSVSARVSPVELVGWLPTGHMTVAMASCPGARPARGRGGARGSCPLGPALSASAPGDFRPVTGC